MTRRTCLTGIKPTGVPHLGNYIGAIRPGLALAERYDAYLFVADYHALISVRDPERLADYTRSVVAAWLACGLDPASTTFYRQSDVPEIFELTWVLGCVTPKGMLNRAHAYKAAVDRNRARGSADPDAGVTAGLFGYPVLMAADILAMSADVVPVGRDQLQHIEYARDIADRFNHAYGQVLTAPAALIGEADEQPLPGLDGRKMSKSYDNTIPLFAGRDELRRLIRRIRTDSAPVEAPKDPDSSLLFDLYRRFAAPAEQTALRDRMRAGGVGWGTLKDELFERLDAALSGPRERYAELMADPSATRTVLAEGAARARARAADLLAAVRAAIGVTAAFPASPDGGPAHYARLVADR